MRYAYFEFQNFKGIKSTRLDLDAAGGAARVFTLVGLNESGKTTILEAIDQFIPTTDETEKEVSPKQLAGWVEPDPHDLIPISERTNFNGQVRVIAGVELDDADAEAVTKRLRELNGFRVSEVVRSVEITISLEFKNSRFEGRSTLWTSTLAHGYRPTGSKLRPVSAKDDRPAWQAALSVIRERVPTIWFFPNFLFEFPRRIDLTPGENETETNRFYRALFQDILDALDKDLTVDEHVVARAQSREAADAANLRQLLVDASRHVTQAVVAAWNDLFADKHLSEKRVQIEYVQGDPATGPDKVFIEFWLEDSDGVFGIHERSLGFRWFFVYLLVTTYRGRRRRGESEILFLFDEPASNLHPRAQGALLTSLEKLSGDAVIVYTTHSHHLVNAAWLGSTYVVVNEGLDPRDITPAVTAQRTDVRVEGFSHFAAQHPNRSHFFQPVLDVLDYAPSELELVSSVVMVEGKTDYYLLRYFQEIVESNADSLALLPGTGSGSLDTVIQLYVAWGRDFVVLLDSDRAGNREKQRYVDKFGPLVENRIFTLGEITRSADTKAIESMLTASDRAALQALADASGGVFDKKTFARGVQQAFATRHALKLSPTTTKNLAQVIAALRAALADRP